MFLLLGSGYCLPEFWEGRLPGRLPLSSTIPKSQSRRQASDAAHLTGRCICNLLQPIVTLTVHA